MWCGLVIKRKGYREMKKVEGCGITSLKKYVWDNMEHPKFMYWHTMDKYVEANFGRLNEPFLNIYEKRDCGWEGIYSFKGNVRWEFIDGKLWIEDDRYRHSFTPLYQEGFKEKAKKEEAPVGKVGYALVKICSNRGRARKLKSMIDDIWKVRYDPKSLNVVEWIKKNP
jgi:hypothetical protein